MVATTSLWLPILLSAVGVFIVSSIVHMFLPYHRTDYGKLPTEDAVLDALRSHAIPPGDYAFPHAAGMEEMKSPEYTEKMKRGPAGILTLWPAGEMNMGKKLGAWFAYTVVVGIFTAYMAGVTLEPGAEYLRVFRVTGTAAFMAYALGQWADTIWFGKSVNTTLKNTFDGLVYGLVTAGCFGWLWPGA
jgi:hypothetical protein